MRPGIAERKLHHLVRRHAAGAHANLLKGFSRDLDKRHAAIFPGAIRQGIRRGREAMGNRFGDGFAPCDGCVKPTCREGDGGMADAALIPFGELVENDATGFLDGDAARDEIIGKGTLEPEAIGKAKDRRNTLALFRANLIGIRPSRRRIGRRGIGALVGGMRGRRFRRGMKVLDRFVHGGSLHRSGVGSDEFKGKGGRLVRSTDLRAGIGADGDEGQFVRRPAFDEPSFRFADTFGPFDAHLVDAVADRDVADDPVGDEREQAIGGFIDAWLREAQACAAFALVDPGAFDDADNRARRPLRMAVEHRRTGIKAREVDGIARDHEDFLVVDRRIKAGPATAAHGGSGAPDDFDGSALGFDGGDRRDLHSTKLRTNDIYRNLLRWCSEYRF